MMRLFQKQLYLLLSLTSAFTFQMITDVQLAVFANVVGVCLFVLVVLYHYVSVNGQKKFD